MKAKSRSLGIFRKSIFIKSISLIIILFFIYGCATIHSRNYQARIKAVNKITSVHDLYAVFLSDKNDEVKMAALNKITDQNILCEFLLSDDYYKVNLDIATSAFNKISDQNLIGKIALEHNSKSFLRRLAVPKITDQNILYQVAMDYTRFALVNEYNELRLVVINKLSEKDLLFKLVMYGYYDEVGIAAFNKITDQNLINKIAFEHRVPAMSKLAVSKITDQNLLYKIALDNINYAATGEAMRRLTSSFLAQLAADFKELNLKINAVNLIKDQTELLKISQNNDIWEVRKLAFEKLNDNSLNILIQESQDPVLILSAKIRLGQTSWNEVFSGKNSPKWSLGVIVGATALVDTHQPKSNDVVSACHKFIQLGDASRIQELIYLLNKFGNVALAEDFMNCGETTLEDAGCKWGRAHGYTCTTGYGSHRVLWGSKK